MPKILITLSKQMVDTLNQLVESGLYTSKSEVVRTAIRQMLRRKPLHEELEEELSEVFPEEEHFIYS